MKAKRLLCILLGMLIFVLCFAFVGCGEEKPLSGDTGKEETPGSPPGDGTDTPEGPAYTLSEPVQIVRDPHFEQGFGVKGQQDGIGTVFGTLGYDDTKTYSPVWTLAQWYCGYYYKQGDQWPSEYNILNAERIQNGDLYIWQDASKTLRVNPTEGSLYMRLEGTQEYTAPKTQSGPWPHLLLEYRVERKYVRDLASLTLKMDYTLNTFKGDMGSDTNADIHCAQFPFYLVVSNVNQESEDYGAYIWFGASLYDNRYDYTLLYASADIGSEDKLATNAFIYKPGSKEYMAAPVEEGTPNVIEWDMLPYIEDAFESAQQNGYLPNTKYEDLAVTSGNFGWEITGTYDAAMKIDEFEIWAVEKIYEGEQENA